MDNLTRQKEHFNSIAKNYFEQRRGEKQVLLHDLIYNELFRHIKIREGKIVVLEPMCGFGEGKRIVQQFFPNEIDYSGFDFSEEIVKCAKEIDKNVNIWVQDVTTFTSQDKYDIIIIVGGLHHVPDYAYKVINNMSMLLNENGLFINVEPTYNNAIYKKICEFVYKRNKLFDNQTERRFSLRELNGMYKACGFKIEKQISAGLLAYILWYNPDAFPLLNRGGTKMVRRVFNFDKLFMHNKIGEKVSVATFTVLKNVEENI